MKIFHITFFISHFSFAAARAPAHEFLTMANEKWKM